MNPTDKKWIMCVPDIAMLFLLFLLISILCGCAAQKPRAAILRTHPGPEHLECTGTGANVDCRVVQSTLTDKDNRQVLTPLGCAMKKAHMLQVFWIGVKNKPVCESEIPQTSTQGRLFIIDKDWQCTPKIGSYQNTEAAEFLEVSCFRIVHLAEP